MILFVPSNETFTLELDISNKLDFILCSVLTTLARKEHGDMVEKKCVKKCKSNGVRPETI